MALFTDRQLLVIGGLVIFGGWLAYRKGEQVVDAINPANPENVINQAFTDSVRGITGRDDWTLGGWIYDQVDSVRGLYGDSDADRLQAIEQKHYRLIMEARERQNQPNYNELPSIF